MFNKETLMSVDLVLICRLPSNHLRCPIRHFLDTHLWSCTDPSRSFLCLLPQSAYHQAQPRQQITKDVMLMAGARQKRLASTANRRKLSADKWDLVLGLSSINWWVSLVEGARYHGGFSSMPLWQSGWRCKEQRHLVTQRCRALLNRWQETSEESGNGQQMEKRLCRRPEECSAYSRHTAVPSSCSHKHLMTLPPSCYSCL